jgi:cytochrome b561
MSTNITFANTRNGFGLVSIAFHWLTLLLLIAVYATMEFKDIYPKASPGREAIMMWHYMLGLTVFGITFLRIAARLAGERPQIVPEPPAWQNKLAAAVHGMLYLMLIGLPILGWLTLSAKGEPIPFFGFELPALLSPDKDLAKQIKEVHETIASVGYAVIGLHAAAGIYHHYFVRDNTLRLMLPRH